MNCWIPEFSTRTDTLMCSSSMRRRARKTFAFGSKPLTARRKPRSCICFLTYGSATPAHSGTKACVHYEYSVPAGESVVLRLRLTPEKLDRPLADVDQVVTQRKKEADQFYATIHPPKASEEEKDIQRQALAGMLWSKKNYFWGGYL